MNTVDVLRRAKEILSDPERWSKTGYGLEAGEPSCAAGAIWLAGHGRRGLSDYVGDPALSALWRAIGGGHGPWGCIAKWNDDPATTHADLIDAFDRAILAEADKKQAARETDAALAVAPVADAIAVLVGE